MFSALSLPSKSRYYGGGPTVREVGPIGLLFTHQSHMDSAELRAIERCQSGQLEDFALLYDRYVKKIYDFVYFKTFHRQTAEDIVSQTFMKALEHIGSYDAGKGNFSSWLYRIAQNSVIDHYRASKPTVDLDAVFDLSSREDVAHDVELKLRLERVQTYLKLLTSEQQQLVMLRIWQGLSYQEIAVVMGKTEAACKMMLSRTLRELQAHLPPSLLSFLCFILLKHL